MAFYYCYILLTLGITAGENCGKNTGNLLFTLFQDKTCLHYIGDISECIQKGLAQVNVAILYYSNVYVGGGVECNASGYIVHFEEANKLKNLFEVRGILIPYRTTVVFLVGSQGVTEEMELAADMEGQNVIVVRNYSSVYDRNQKRPVQGGPLQSWSPNFKNRTFRVAMFQMPMSSSFDEEGTLTNGLDKYMFEYVMPDWPIEYILLPDFSWLPALEIVEEFKAHLAPSGNWQSYVLKYDVDTSYPYESCCATVAVPKPELLPQEYFVFRPLELQMWLALFANTLAIAVCYKFTKDENSIGLLVKVFGTLLLNPDAQLSKGGSFNSSLFALLHLLGLLMGTCYQAGITSSIAAPGHTPLIRTFKDVFERGLRTNNNVTFQLLRESDDPYQNAIANSPTVYNPEVTVNEIYSINKLESTVFLTDHTVTSSRKHQLTLIKQCMGIYAFAHAFNKNSAFTKIFDDHIIRASEFGLINFWLKLTALSNYQDLKDMKTFYLIYSNLPKGPQVLGLIKMQGAFYLLALGLSMSYLVFICERCKTQVKSN